MKNLFSIFLFGVFLLAGVQVQAHVSDGADTPEPITVDQQEKGVFVHISAQIKVVKRTPNGLICEILSIRQGKKANPGRNFLNGSMRIVGKKAQIKLDDFKMPINRITLDNGLHLSESLSKKLGASKSVVMSGGSTMLKKQGNSLLQFEIQM